MNTAKAVHMQKMVSNSPSTIFSKQDVLNILTFIGTPEPYNENSNPPQQPDPVSESETITITKKNMCDFIEYMEDIIHNLIDNEVVDLNSAEFTICDNYIELNDITLDKDFMIQKFKEALEEYFDAQ